MYEPKYLPELNEKLGSFSNIRFGIDHFNKYHPSLDPDADPLHVHKSLEIFFNISADASFLVNNNLYPVSKMSAVVSRPGDIHMCIFHKEAVMEYVCLWIDADLDLPAFSFLKNDGFCPLFSFDGDAGVKLKSLTRSLAELCQSGGSELEKTVCLLRILLLFEKGHATLPEKPIVPESFQRILDDIHENFSTIRSVNDIIDTHFISSATLTRRFRKYIHTTPREYLESVRLSNAAMMLSGGASVTEACMNSGFSDCSHFIVLFKKKFGITPFQYKKDRTV
ncbi:MAG: helix-turn-helix transcriptional regulator [Clostridia bacterium]|nr:helix-turn-helix transcriptional regulator [Clostridia bacterium]